MPKLEDTIYCIAYQNHRYGEGEYQIMFCYDEKYREQMIETFKGKPGVKVKTFEFRPIDIMKGG